MTITLAAIAAAAERAGLPTFAPEDIGGGVQAMSNDVVTFTLNDGQQAVDGPAEFVVSVTGRGFAAATVTDVDEAVAVLLDVTGATAAVEDPAA